MTGQAGSGFDCSDVDLAAGLTDQRRGTPASIIPGIPAYLLNPCRSRRHWSAPRMIFYLRRSRRFFLRELDGDLGCFVDNLPDGDSFAAIDLMQISAEVPKASGRMQVEAKEVLLSDMPTIMIDDTDMQSISPPLNLDTLVSHILHLHY
ncbi:hypothetical protein ZWY2020_047870 [Hordeum vulgare]|nr:hypothetical protein ZWY2020_047870 [Hordeum vulgare]